ncbi:MAG: hypothetical protein ACOY6K_05475 [Pseudomonadota bacterium]
MRLRAIDQVHISSVKSDSLRPGDEFEVSDSAGAELLAKLPGKVAQLGDAATTVTNEKAAPPPQNKAEDPPSNKSKPKPRSKQSTDSKASGPQQASSDAAN